MPRFFGRVPMLMLATTVAVAVTLVIAGAPSSALAAGKRKAKVKHRKPVAAERLVPATRRGQPNVQAPAALVIDETGAQVFAHNPDQERPIASIS
jgi:D-alanyl-D-alanine carboxypeptidase